MTNKTARFPNSADQDRTEIGYATIPFKSGEWDGTPLEVVDSDGVLIKDAWVYPFGKKYPDNTHRYGALMTRLSIPGKSEQVVTVRDASNPITEPVFRYSQGLGKSSGFRLFLATTKDSQVTSTGFSDWTTIEDNGMRRVFQSVSRIGHFVANVKLYVYNDQDLIKWELDVTGSDPSTTIRTYDFDELHFLILGDDHLLNIRGAARRGVHTLKANKHFRLMKSQDGPFGDGQKQSWYGELITLAGNAESTYSAAAALAFPFHGMSQDWVEAGEAFGALGVVPETPVVIPNGGFQAIANKYVSVWNYMNQKGTPWEDYPEGLTKTPGQTGNQLDFGILKGWDILYTGMAELVEIYRFLATEDAKRPGHYLEMDGTQVTHANHPKWVTWSGVTHWHFNVSKDRLGKTDPNAIMNSNGWVGKDWEHMSSNLLYIASLLTGSYQLRDEQNHEVEYYLAGHTVPSEFPGWSTNSRGEPRGFGRTHLALLHHDTILDREDILNKAMDRFEQVIRFAWTGASNNPVQPWSLTNDPRVFPNRQTAWVPWNNQLGWIGIVALWRATQDPNVQQVMVDWGKTIINWGFRINANGSVDLGHGCKWLPGGVSITTAQFNDPNFWIPTSQFSHEWGLAVCKFAKDSDLFDAVTKARAQQIFDEVHRRRMASYNPAEPFDSFGEWTALDGTQMGQTIS